LNHRFLSYIYAVEIIFQSVIGLQIWCGFQHEYLGSKAYMRICKKVR
jgi:hypothetical protein